jgi:hypothetical protein
MKTELPFATERTPDPRIIETRKSEELVAVDSLVKKIQSLSPEKAAEVEDFVDFLRLREEETRLTHAAAQLSEEAFAEVWGNPEDAVYDDL